MPRAPSFDSPVSRRQFYFNEQTDAELDWLVEQIAREDGGDDLLVTRSSVVRMLVRREYLRRAGSRPRH
jgi:hypothetical protein